VRSWLAVEIARVPDDTSPSLRRKANQPTTGKPDNERVHSMLYTIAVVLLILWLLGLVSSYTIGGFIHILLVVAIVMILVNIISGRRAL
jgi:hypothetical protein